MAELDLEDEEAPDEGLEKARGGLIARGPREPGLTTDEEVAARQRLVVATALEEWNRGVREPRHGTEYRRIETEYIAGESGLAWTWQRYEKDGDLAWCGAFAAYCHGRAGLRRELRSAHLASCYKLCKWSKGNARRVDWHNESIRPGDIVIVGGAKAKSWGQHITICERFDAERGEVHTIEGNATGLLPDGTTAEGVIRRRRSLPRPGLSDKSWVMHVIRPLADDFLAVVG